MTGTATPTEVALRAGDARARVQGGGLLSVRSLELAGREVLADPAGLPPDYLVHGHRAGITLLHPWANRLARTAFTLAGTEVRVDPGDPRLSRDAQGLAIHGVEARPPWQPTADGDATAHATLRWAEHPAFPFPHRVEVTIALAAPADGVAELTVHTRLSADPGSPLPVSIGWHPYFRTTRPAQMSLPDLAWVLADERGLPAGGTRAAGAEVRTLAGNDRLDDGITGLSPGVELALSDAAHRCAITFVSGYPHGQVFAPPDAPIVSLEPMTALTDALVSGQGLTVLAGGGSYEAEFRIRVERH